MADTGTVKFKGDLDAFAKQFNVDLGLAVQKIVLDTHTEVTKLTPVDTGRLRAAWVVGVGAANESAPPEIDKATLEKREKDKADGKTTSAIVAAPEPPDVSGIDGTQPVFITNNLVYAEAIENGHSQQAPNGMLKVGVATIEAQFVSDGGALIGGPTTA